VITDEELKKVYGMFTDAWKFYKKYADVQQSDEYWEAIVDESRQIAKKYDNAKLAIALLLATIDELERKSKEVKMLNRLKSD
jgi:Zn-dependent M32 family carboxypeptidase